VRNFFSGLRFRLLLLVVLAAAPAVALTFHSAWENRRRQTTGWKHQAERLSQLAGREEQNVIGATRELLLALAESSQVRESHRQDCKKLLDKLFVSHPHYVFLGVVKTNGEILASARSLAPPANPAERPFFRKALEKCAFTIAYPRGQNTGRPTIDFGYPVFNSTGEVQSVVFAALDLDWLSRFESELPAQLPAGATWTEVDRNGTILARYPDPGKWLGRPLAETALLKAVSAHERGAVETADAQGLRSFYVLGTRPNQLVGEEVATILGIPRQVLYAEADRLLVRHLIWSAIAASLALAIGWIASSILVLRHLKALVKSSTRLAAGDLSARTGLPHGRDELGQLKRAFDQMAQALEQRELDHLQTSQRLQVLSHRLVEVQETERRRIARELHDEIGQSLTVAEMNLQAALRAPGGKALAPQLRASIEVVERVLEQVQDLSLNLRPSMLDDLGLEPALRWYLNRQAALTGLKAEFRADVLEHRVDSAIETECFRVAQEALTNVVRHSEASAVVVELRKRDGHLHLSVRDDGIGFDVMAIREQAVRGASLGLLSMEERASLAGGGVTYRSARGRGTEVRAWFPLKWQTPQA
jgi:signal transduction histidine kinase